MIRVLAFTAIFAGIQPPNIHSNIYEEYVLLSKKNKLTIITHKIKSKSNENITLVEVPKRNIPIVGALHEILTFLIATIQNRKKFEIIFVRTLGRHYLIPSIIAKRIFKKKFVVWVPGSFKTQERKKIFHRNIIKTSLKVADIICAASEQVIKDVEKNLGKIDRSKVKIISEPINISLFKPDEKISTENKILSVCRIVPLKGIETIIESLSHVIKEIPDVKFFHVGPVKDEKYLQRLKNLAKNLGCERSVIFQGAVARDNLVNTYNSSKIFILTSKTEGQSLATQEALACGKPVIVTPVGAIPDYVKDGVNGFHLKSEDPKELAKIIIKLLKDDELREKIGRAARKSIEDRSLEETFVNELTSTFNKLLTN